MLEESRWKITFMLGSFYAEANIAFISKGNGGTNDKGKYKIASI